MKIVDWLAQPDGLADRLRALRTQAGLSGKELAAINGWQPSKVSRLENGRQMPSPLDLDAWATACNASVVTAQELHGLLAEAQTMHRNWRRRTRRGLAQVQSHYHQLVEDSDLIRHFETVYVPGLLQTVDYARRVLSEMVDLHSVSVQDLDAAVAARMRRQQALYEPTKQFEFLLAEPVLRWQLCPAAAMRSQLDRLQTIIGVPNILFGVIPMNKILETTPQNSFQIYDNIAVVETFIGETEYRDEDAHTYSTVMERLWSEAATDEEARRLIIDATKSIP